MAGFNSLTFDTLLPWPLLALLAGVALLLLGLAAWRRARGVLWRALALLIGFVILSNPLLVEEQRKPLPDVALAVIDHSASMGIADRQAQAQAAEAALRAKLGVMPGLELRVVQAGQIDDPTDDGGTRLFGAIDRALADTPPERLAAVLMVTDGRVHDIPPAAAAARLGGPLQVLLAGHRDEADRRLVIEQAPAYGLVGHDASLTLRVEDSAAGAAGGSARVTLSVDGGAPEQLTLPIGRSETLPLPLTHAGPTVIEAEVAPGTRELTLLNNRAAVTINGVRNRLKVLLVSGEPHAGERVWRNLLKADPSVDLVHFTILRSPDAEDMTPIKELSLIAFPIRELFQTKLRQFDLVIFDRYRQLGVLPTNYFQNIVDYLYGGGALLDISGPDYAGPASLVTTPLADVLPGQPTGEVLTQGFKPMLTAVGRRHPVTADLPGAGPPGGTPTWGRWFRDIAVEPRRGEVLMTGSGAHPLLLLDRVGKGRVAQLFSDQIWLWARGFEGGGPQVELLRRLSHWLMKEPELEEEDLTASANGNRLEIQRRSLTPGDVAADISGADGSTHHVLLKDQGDGRATGGVSLTVPGLYRVSDGQRTAVAAVGPANPKEFAEVTASAAPLTPAVQATGGSIGWLDDGMPEFRRVGPKDAHSGPGWIGLVAHGDYTVTGVRQEPLLPIWAALALLLATLMTAWWREGR